MNNILNRDVMPLPLDHKLTFDDSHISTHKVGDMYEVDLQEPDHELINILCPVEIASIKHAAALLFYDDYEITIADAYLNNLQLHNRNMLAWSPSRPSVQHSNWIIVQHTNSSQMDENHKQSLT